MTVGFPYRVDRPLNFGHRGAPSEAPENTIAAFESARQAGADGVELDVQLSQDGHLVVIHDEVVNRTSNGQGRVAELTLEQIQRLDAGSWFEATHVHERIPTLADVFAWAGDDMLLNIEIKDRHLVGRGIEEKVADAVRNSGLRGRVLVSSFNPFVLGRMHGIAPEIPTGLLYSPELPLYLRRAWLRPLAQPSALHPHYALVNEPYLRRARALGLRVNVWTVDETATMQHLISQKVDAIITNQPAALARLMKR